MMPEEPIYTGAGFMDAYLVEARSIGGLSRSPVVIHFSMDRLRGEAFSGTALHPKHYLLGMVHGHFIIENPEDAVAEGDESAGKINTGIGLVVPVSKIVETINRPDLAAKRKEIVAGIREKVRRHIVQDDF